MVRGELVEFITARATRAELEDIEHEAALPHLVACTDTVSGYRSYSGPYASRAAARSAAAYEADLECDDEGRLLFTVEPVFPPIGHHLSESAVRDIAR